MVRKYLFLRSVRLLSRDDGDSRELCRVEGEEYGEAEGVTYSQSDGLGGGSIRKVLLGEQRQRPTVHSDVFG